MSVPLGANERPAFPKSQKARPSVPRSASFRSPVGLLSDPRAQWCYLNLFQVPSLAVTSRSSHLHRRARAIKLRLIGVAGSQHSVSFIGPQICHLD